MPDGAAPRGAQGLSTARPDGAQADPVSRGAEARGAAPSSTRPPAPARDGAGTATSVRPSLNRRDFLIVLARGLLLLGIGLLAVKLLGGRLGRWLGGGSGQLRPVRSDFGRSPAGLPGQDCVNRGICRGCPSFAGCGLPQALSARRRAPWAQLDGGSP